MQRKKEETSWSLLINNTAYCINKNMKLKKSDYIDIIKTALKEDLKNFCDVTSSAIFKNENSVYILIAKDSGILCGKDIFIEVFKTVDKNCKVTTYFNDMDCVHKGETVAKIEGKVISILTAERTAINFVSHLSGISTKTAAFVEKAKGKIKILDTRKTIPGLRTLQKYAVFCGGGLNHRMGLFDMVLIKDNHIDAAGSITNAVHKVKNKWKNKYKIEVETRTLAEVAEALDCNADRIMLDNMSIALMKKAIFLIGKKCECEISGNVTLKKIKKIIKTGADFVSIGELTHTVDPFDFSLIKEK